MIKKALVIVLAVNLTVGYAFGQTKTVVPYEFDVKNEDLGNYNVMMEAHERPQYEVLPIVDESYFNKTDATFNTEVDNTAPSALYDARPVTKVDVMIAVGEYAQTDSLNSYAEVIQTALNQASNGVDARVESLKTSYEDLLSGFEDTDYTHGVGIEILNKQDGGGI